ncbi:MAG: hypothetical protein ACRDJ2_03620, partial [Actinomycetota bacterium]
MSIDDSPPTWAPTEFNKLLTHYSTGGRMTPLDHRSETIERVALYLQDKHPIRDGIRYVQRAEAAGFEAVWQAESRLVREATVPRAAFAAS